MSDADSLDDLFEDNDDLSLTDTSKSIQQALSNFAPNQIFRQHLPFEEAANKIKNRLLDLVDDLCSGKDLGILITGSAGVGKTESMLTAAQALLDKGQQVLWACPTIEMANETAARAASKAIDAHVLHGRNEATCHHMDKVRLARSEGYSPGAFVCPSCPRHPDNLPGQMVELWTCGHYAKILRAKRSIKEAKNLKIRLPMVVTTYENAVSGLKHAQKTREGEIWRTRQVFFDEDPSRAMRQRSILSDEDLLRTPKEEIPTQMLRLLARARAIASDSRTISAMNGFRDKNGHKDENHGFDGSTFCGRELHHLLFSAARDIGIDLETTLARASEWSPKVMKGDLYYADKGLIQFIVNAGLPHFADALHKEITFDYSGTPSTYSVRLETTDDRKGWRYVLDRLVPLRTGKDNVILGDAYADPSFVKKLFGGRPFSTIDVRVAIPSNVRVFRSTSAKTSSKVMKNDDLLTMLLDTEVSAVLSGEKGRKVLVYSQLAYKNKIEDWCASQEITYGLSDICFEHYWSGRGKDQYKNFDTILCIGEPVPNIKGLVHEANALHPEEPEIIVTNHSSKVWSSDHRLERVWNMLATQELAQALMRLRPGIPSLYEKRLFIFGQQVPLSSDFLYALSAFNYQSPNGVTPAPPKAGQLSHGKLEVMDPETVRDHIIWVFQTTGCWCHYFITDVMENPNDFDSAAVLLKYNYGRAAALRGTLSPHVVHGGTRRRLWFSWLRSHWTVRSGIELATQYLPSPIRVRPSWLPKLSRPVEVFGDDKTALEVLETYYGDN